MTTFNQSLPSVTIKVTTPDGTMFATIVDDDNGKPTRLLIVIGKAGSRLAAWCDATGRLVSQMFKRGVSVNEIVSEIAGISSDKLSMNGQTEIRSAPEGIAKALIMYEEYKWRSR